MHVDVRISNINKSLSKKKVTNLFSSARNLFCLFLLVSAIIRNDTGEIAETEVEENEVVTDEVAVADTRDNNVFNTQFVPTNYYEEWDKNDDNLLDENKYAAYNTYFSV